MNSVHDRPELTFLESSLHIEHFDSAPGYCDKRTLMDMKPTSLNLLGIGAVFERAQKRGSKSSSRKSRVR
jgi:hypothetical protein